MTRSYATTASLLLTLSQGTGSLPVSMEEQPNGLQTLTRNDDATSVVHNAATLETASLRMSQDSDIATQASAEGIEKVDTRVTEANLNAFLDCPTSAVVQVETSDGKFEILLDEREHSVLMEALQRLDGKESPVATGSRSSRVSSDIARRSNDEALPDDVNIKIDYLISQIGDLNHNMRLNAAGLFSIGGAIFVLGAYAILYILAPQIRQKLSRVKHVLVRLHPARTSNHETRTDRVVQEEIQGQELELSELDAGHGTAHTGHAV